MLIDINFSKTQLSKIIQSGMFLGKTVGNVMGNLCKKALIDFVALTNHILPIFTTKETSAILKTFERRLSDKELYEQKTDSLYSYLKKIYPVGRYWSTGLPGDAPSNVHMTCSKVPT